ncbi:hypothetical protein [Polycyclovorans algicola]|uniref:hypothetical protein n=1 Tax=Polycyclovorans algicola TaxID=616992 RepID=UPI00069373EB|nr:hypothetical protein [Polycyclovorans algicola]
MKIKLNTAPLAPFRLPSALTVAGLCLGLQGCIDGTQSPPPEVVNPDPDVCAFLPVDAVTWKGGNTWGEELTVSLDPDTMAYEITIDDSLQRTAGTVLGGTLVPREQDCTYDSDEAGAVFTLASDGLLLGGATAPDDGDFAPLLAFRDTFNNAADPERFNEAAFIGNVIGVHDAGAGQQSLGGASRLRNAGTLQVCLPDDANGFALYDNNCEPRERGYLTYNADRDVFERYSTPPEEPTPTSGGTLSGSAIIGLVGEDTVMLELVRDAVAGFGLRLHTLQPQDSSEAMPLVGGSFVTLDTDGGNAFVTVTDTDITRGDATGTLTPDTPTFGVAEADGDIAGNLIILGEVYAFVPADEGPALALGLRATGEDAEPTLPPVAACGFLPDAAASYKGGNTAGEELTLALDPDTLAYSITIDASVQRTVGTELSGTLTPVDECTYSTDESGAEFTLASGGVLQGGVTAGDGTTVLPLLAFADTFNNAETPTVFNPVAFIANVIGAQHDGATVLPYGGSGRIRNAGTFQLCRDEVSDRFVTYSPGCARTDKGYLTYNAGRDAFDLFTTDPEGSAVTSGGELSGSMVIGLVNGSAVPLQLVRESAASHGMRLFTPQDALASGVADGTFNTLDTAGGNARVSIAGADFSRGDTSALLSFDTPVSGVTEVDGGVSGNFLFSGGIYGFIPTAGDPPAFELGVVN